MKVAYVNRNLAVFTLIEKFGAIEIIAPEQLHAVALAMLDGRCTCCDRRVSEAVKAYDGEIQHKQISRQRQR